MRELQKTENQMRKINSIILHCSATSEGKHIDTETIRQWHLQRGWDDIGYHYVIELDGSIHKGRDEGTIGAHCFGHNTDSIGICYVGGLTSDGKQPKDTRTEEQKKSLYKLTKDLQDKYNIPLSEIHCHNEFANKACPSFSIETFKEELINQG